MIGQSKKVKTIMHIQLFGDKPWCLLDMATGINKCGDTWRFATFKEHDLIHYGLDCDAIFIMGWTPQGQDFSDYFRDNVPVFFVTDGYVNRRTYDKKGRANYFNGCHFGVSLRWPAGYGSFNRGPHPQDRWNKLQQGMPPARKNGSTVLVGFQETRDIYNNDRNNYFQFVVNYVTQKGHAVRMRVHPRFDNRIAVEKTCIYGFQGTLSKADEVSLADDLKGCDCLVTYDSNIAVEAALLGYPVVEFGRSMAHPIATHWSQYVERNAKVLPVNDIQEWCNWLAYQQWTRDEMAAGDCWHYLKTEVLKCV